MNEVLLNIVNDFLAVLSLTVLTFQLHLFKIMRYYPVINKWKETVNRFM